MNHPKIHFPEDLIKIYLRQQYTDTTAQIHSVTGNDIHTPLTPIIQESRNAHGIMIPILRRNDISNEGIPFPSPSSAPVTVQETVEIMNPVLMIFKAVLPS